MAKFDQPGTNIWLIGMMGVGKTTLSRLIARQLHYEMVDVDRELECATGVTISTIFEIEGEESFRQREKKIIASLASRIQSGKQRYVLATGGGSILLSENQARMRESGLVIYLQAEPEGLLSRVRANKKRPLLAVSDPLRELCEIYRQRGPLYEAAADMIVHIDGNLGATHSANFLLERIREQWSRCQ